jgi:hypothetical protein
VASDDRAEELTSLLGNNEEVTVRIAQGASIHGLVSSIPALCCVHEGDSVIEQLVATCTCKQRHIEDMHVDGVSVSEA